MSIFLNSKCGVSQTLTLDYGHASAIHIIIERQDGRFNLPGVLEVYCI